jgi:hypothetical protein
MAIKLTQLSCKYGAPMGRANDHISGKCKLQKCPMIDGGAYDNGGAYWGIGYNPLWVCQDLDGGFFFVRAKNRNEAKKLIQEDMRADDVSFYR